MAEKIPTRPFDSNPYRQGFGGVSNPMIQTQQPSESEAPLNGKRSIKVASKSHRKSKPNTFEAENSDSNCITPENFAVSTAAFKESSDPVSKPMMISFGLGGHQVSSAENSREYISNEICSSELADRDLHVLVNTENLSNLKPDDDIKDINSGPKHRENQLLLQNNSSQGVSMPSLKQMTLLDMGITCNLKKRETDFVQENGTIKNARVFNKSKKLHPTGPLSKRYICHQWSTNKSTKEKEEIAMSEAHKKNVIMGFRNEFTSDLRLFNQFDRPLVKALDDHLYQNDTNISSELTDKTYVGQDHNASNHRKVNWQSSINYERPKASRTRSDEDMMMIEDQADSKVISFPLQNSNTQATLLSTQCTGSQSDRLVNSNSNFTGLVDSHSQSMGSVSFQNFSCFGNQIINLTGLSQGKTVSKPEIAHDKSNTSKIRSPNKKAIELRSNNSLESSVNSRAVSLYKSIHKRKNFSTTKTESTYISGLDSTPTHLLLECEESPYLLFSSATKKGHKNERIALPELYEEELKVIEHIPKVERRVSEMNIEEIAPTSTLQEELAKFNSVYYNSGLDSEAIEFLVLRERDYTPDPFFLDSKQKHISGQMRAILLDWLMEVSDEFALKRETFFYSINYIDRYLAEVGDIEKNQFQLIGLTALHIAAKIEEIAPPKLIDFAQAANYCYSIETIRATEIKMLKALKWILTPPTLNTWAQWYTKQWDLYTEKLWEHPLVIKHGSAIQFRKETEKSYALYREMMQLIDCAILDTQTLQYNNRALTASFMYLVLGKRSGAFTLQQIYKEMPQSSLYLLNTSDPFNLLFGDFLMYCFEYSLPDLLPAVQYAATFFGLAISYDMPSIIKQNKEAILDGHFEDFLAYQTHNRKAKDYAKFRQETFPLSSLAL